ncbi:MAG: hypothetical protein Q8M01_11395 [Rubrivivax sp.]|nr:hypothetical protein [Rubrivivax sp.]
MWKHLALLWTMVRGDARLLWRGLHQPASPRRLPPALCDETARQPA